MIEKSHIYPFNQTPQQQDSDRFQNLQRKVEKNFTFIVTITTNWRLMKVCWYCKLWNPTQSFQFILEIIPLSLFIREEFRSKFKMESSTYYNLSKYGLYLSKNSNKYFPVSQDIKTLPRHDKALFKLIHFQSLNWWWNSDHLKDS